MQDYTASFARLRPDFARQGGAWLLPARERALTAFTTLGLPTPSHEDWRYTNVAPIARASFVEDAGDPAGLDPAMLATAFLPGLDSTRLVFVDGRFAPTLSVSGSVPEGVRVGSLARALGDDSGWVKQDWIEPWLSRIAEFENHPFTALNTALFRDGAFVYVPRGIVVAEPLHVVHVATAGRVSHPRHLFVVGEHAQLQIIESWIGFGGDAPSFTNPVSELALGEGAVVEHVKLGLEAAGAFHVATVAVRLERAAGFTSRNFCFGGALARNDIHVVQTAPGTHTTLDGLFVLGATQHTDNHTSMDHAAPHGTSHQLYKGILDGQAHGVFNGKVLVRPGAQKTDSRQVNRNLLLSSAALIDTKPELEIFADDVKCSHGATIGQLDEAALFYLRSRGLGPEEARGLLTWAFASEVISRVRWDQVRTRLRGALGKRLPGGARLEEMR